MTSIEGCFRTVPWMGGAKSSVLFLMGSIEVAEEGVRRKSGDEAQGSGVNDSISAKVLYNSIEFVYVSVVAR